MGSLCSTPQAAASDVSSVIKDDIVATGAGPRTVVVGANRGIGLALVKEFAGSCDVIATTRSPDENLKGLRCTVVEGVDITKGDSLVALQDACKDGIQTLIVNAGLLEAGSDPKKCSELEEKDLSAFTREWEVNCLGVLRVVSKLHGCLAEGAKVILLGTTLSSFEQTDGGLYGYRATKAALHMVGKNLAIELKGKASVAVIHPGFVETGMTAPLGFKAGAGGVIDTATSAKGIVERINALKPETSGMSCDYSGAAFNMGGPKCTVAEEQTKKAEGATVIIGGNRGIGLDLVKNLVTRGDQVIATHRAANSAAAGVSDVTGVTAWVGGVDITKASAAKTLVDGMKASGQKKIAIVIVNAGLLEAGADTKKLPDMTEDDFAAFSREWHVNCLGTLRMIAGLWKYLVSGAKIVLLGTTLASFDQTDGGLYGYRSTKAALHMVGKNLAIELTNKASVMIVHPGFVETGMTAPLGFKAGEGGVIDTNTSAKGIIYRMEHLHLKRSGVTVDQAGEHFAY